MAKQEPKRAIESADWHVSRRQINEEADIPTIMEEISQFGKS